MNRPGGPPIQPALKALSGLLSYPREEVRAHIEEIEGVLAVRPELSTDDLATLENFLEWLRTADLLDLQAAFVETFDRSKQVSLYLFEHVYGESRDRGPAMVELRGAYRENGLEMDSRELPDFLPLFLEFCAERDEAAAREWLQETGPILQQVHVRLRERESPFAVPFRVLLRVLGLDPEPEELTEATSKEVRDDTREALDRTWMEAPVTFGPDQPATDCGATRQEPEQPIQWVERRSGSSGGSGSP